MPQKQNPDVLELARGYYHRLTAELQSLASTPANLPGGYHRDLQLTKGALMRSLRITGDVLTALRQVVEGLSFRREQTEAACTPEILATYRALRRVDEGVPFRTAYREAAAEADDGPVTPDVVLAAYRTDGSPGRERPDRVRERLDEHTDWTIRPDASGGGGQR
jgi:argininosuccinate lyase